MADATELRKLVKKLQEKSNSESDIVDLLKLLKKDFVVTESILRESKAGLAVGKLRQHNSKEISELAKELVKKWKGQVEQAKQGSGGTPQSNGKAPTPASKPSPANAATPTTPVVSNTPRTAKSDGAKGGTGDSTRDRCVELIYDGLAVDSPAPIEQILNKARGVEKGVYNHIGNTGNDYKQKIRSLFVNLKDKNNPGLRKSVVEGNIPAEKLATMSSQDLASEDRKNADRKIEEENLFKSLAAHEQQAETDAFQCGRCKQRKCRYRQAQTRSADEPMTTFVTCTNCGNRWKFS